MANGPGSYKTQAVTLSKPGIYQYQETAPADENHVGFTTPCNLASERAVVRAKPTLHTVVSAQTVAPGASLTDSVTVSGLAGEHITVQAALYGPFPARDAIACTGTPAWTGTIDVTADGTFQTEAYVVTTPGYYTYYESIAAAEFVTATKTACAETAETAIVTGQPKLQTLVSAQRAKPGATIRDKVIVTGTGVLSLSIQAALYGPFATHGRSRARALRSGRARSSRRATGRTRPQGSSSTRPATTRTTRRWLRLRRRARPQLTAPRPPRQRSSSHSPR